MRRSGGHRAALGAVLVVLLTAAAAVVVVAPQWWRPVLVATAAFGIVSELALWRWLVRRPTDPTR